MSLEVFVAREGVFDNSLDSLVHTGHSACIVASEPQLLTVRCEQLHEVRELLQPGRDHLTLEGVEEVSDVFLHELVHFELEEVHSDALEANQTTRRSLEASESW